MKYKHKHKVGDKVRVRKDLVVGNEYYMEDAKWYACFIAAMSHLRGQIVTIQECANNGRYCIEESGWYWTDEMFEPVNNEKIVITTDGKETFAKLYRGDELVTAATAVCCEEDEFNFNEGAKIAFERLCEAVSPKFNVGDYAIVTKQFDCHCFKIGTVVRVVSFCNGQYMCEDGNGDIQPMTADEIKPCNYYTGKVVCVKAGMTNLTVGKVYNFAENNCCGKNDNGNGILCYPATSLDEINDRLYGAEFIEFKGE